MRLGAGRAFLAGIFFIETVEGHRRQQTIGVLVFEPNVVDAGARAILRDPAVAGEQEAMPVRRFIDLSCRQHRRVAGDLWGVIAGPLAGRDHKGDAYLLVGGIVVELMIDLGTEVAVVGKQLADSGLGD